MMVAPRARACSSSSSTRIPAPSPSTNPSRSPSNGRLAVSGESLRVESAVMLAKPATAMRDTAASVPPQIITSASPWRIACMALPTACAPEAQAETVQ
jgi:hypothetical protein